MLRSDWLSYYWAICYSPLVAKSAGVLAAKKDLLPPNSWAIDSEPIRARGIIVKYTLLSYYLNIFVSLKRLELIKKASL